MALAKDPERKRAGETSTTVRASSIRISSSPVKRKDTAQVVSFFVFLPCGTRIFFSRNILYFASEYHNVSRDSGLSKAIPRKGAALQWKPASGRRTCWAPSEMKTRILPCSQSKRILTLAKDPIDNLFWRKFMKTTSYILIGTLCIFSYLSAAYGKPYDVEGGGLTRILWDAT